MILSFIGSFCFTLIMGRLLFPYTDTFFYSDGDIRLVVNGASNAFHYWSLDPIFGAISRNFKDWVFPFMGGVLSSGLFFWMKRFSENGTILALLSIGSTVLLFAVFGFDVTLFGSLIWAPWFFGAFDRLLINNERKEINFILFLFFAYIFSKGAHEMMLPVVGVFLFASFFRVEEGNKKTFGILTLVSLIFSFKELWYLIPPPFPDYPPFSRVLWPIYLHLDPSFGPHLPIPIIDREAIFPVLISLGGLLAIFGLEALCLKRSQKWISSLVLALGISLVWDSLNVVPEAGGEIGPIAALSRMISGLSFHSVGVMAGGASFLFLPLLFLSKARAGFYFFAGLILQTIVIFNGRPLIISKEGSSALVSMEKSDYALKIGNSPSFPIFRDELDNVLPLKERLQRVSKRKLTRFPHKLHASHSPEHLHEINSDSLGRRWTPGGGKQRGDEWLHIQLAELIDIDGVKITTGWYSGDFPRGVEISGSENCDYEKDGSFERYDLMFRKNPWLGGIQFTENGYPYIEPRHLGTFIFSSTKKVKCLLIKQTSKEDKLDWSVGEIYLFIPKK